jgi:hypothetical protein
MPKWAKILLIIVGVFVVLGIGVIIAGVVWWNKGGGKEMLEGAVQAVQDGQTYGRTSDNAACVNEAVVRYKRSSDLTNIISAKSFLTGCLQTSKSTPSFCDGVPTRLQFTESARWKQDQCRERGMESDTNCQQLFDAVQQHCEQKRD